ncbi:MAG: mechanosensitive ion channel family protein [Thermodesulfatator sp.]|nr:MAG: mechanosensitive ion channel family protein [Thermodesulfatator sp.]
MFLSYVVTRYLAIRFIHAALRRTRNKWDDILIEKKVFVPFALLAPAIVFNYAGRLVPDFPQILLKFSFPFVVFSIVLVIDRLLSAGLAVYGRKTIARRWPIKGYVQILKLFLYLAAGIIAVCRLLDESPWGLLSGLGAVTAFVILVFKDTILSFVASIQIVTNDLIRVGDWIEMPQFQADGDVIEIALYTVKVQNWDKTITTIPTRKFMEHSFRNWRGMKIAGGRRIKRAILIDQLSIRFCDRQMIEKFRKIQILKKYIQAKEQELDEYNRIMAIDDSVMVNGRRMTNLGTFRAYLIEYLKQNPNIRKDMTFLVRQLAPTPDGLPLEIYVFSKNTEWAAYEAIQSDIFDHVLACVPEFGLRVYQRPSGSDLKALRG